MAWLLFAHLLMTIFAPVKINISIQPKGALILAQFKLSLTTCDLKMGWIEKEKMTIWSPKIMLVLMILMSFLHSIFSPKKATNLGWANAQKSAQVGIIQVRTGTYFHYVKWSRILSKILILYLETPSTPLLEFPDFFLFPYIPNMLPHQAVNFPLHLLTHRCAARVPPEILQQLESKVPPLERAWPYDQVLSTNHGG